jgi:hypothetical protein
MKKLRISVCLLLILAAQVFAQRFTAGAVDSMHTGFVDGGGGSGHFPNEKQIALLGEKSSSYANVMLVGGPYTLYPTTSEKKHSYIVMSSYGYIFDTIYPLTATNTVTNSEGETFNDNTVGAVLVLDSLNDNKKNAIVLFSSLTKLFVMQITVDNSNKMSHNILRKIDLPKFMWVGGSSYQGRNRRLALLGVNQNGSDKTYHIAIGNPNSKYEANTRSGRVDFFSLKEGTWDYLQHNTQGLASGVNGLSFGTETMFGVDLVPITDKNGKNALAVLLPQSSLYPQSAVYIFSMDNEWTPSTKSPIILTGNTMPWAEESGQKQSCNGLSIANWQKPHLLVSCNLVKTSTKSIIVKDIVLDSNFKILNSSILFSRSANISNSNENYYIYANPLPIKNHRNYSHAVSIVTNGPGVLIQGGSLIVFPIMDADFSKNFSIEAGKPEMIVNLDSLFYKSGTSGFSAKTLSGLVQCEAQNNNLLCEGEENAIGSWSALELSSKSGCDPYRECKRKDTIFVYVRSQKDPPNTALRISKDIVIPFFERKIFNDLESLSLFKNPNSQSTRINWDASRLKLSVAASNKPNELSIISLSQKEGIDTVVFNLSISSTTDKYPVRFHIADSSKILNKGIPEKPSDNDTIWNTAQKRYVALPYSNSNGNIYTYDIAQDNLEKYAEITGNYLHILKVEVANIFIAYTENSQIKHRKITLMPENSNSPDKIITSSQTQNLKAMHVNGGLQINGLNGEFEIKAYNFKGAEIQRKRAYAQGSTFVKLERNCPQIVQIKSGNQKIYVRIVN